MQAMTAYCRRLGTCPLVGGTQGSAVRKVQIIFQPAEEGVRGARAMCEAGIVDDVDYFLSGHVGGVIGRGEVAVMDMAVFSIFKV